MKQCKECKQKLSVKSFKKHKTNLDKLSGKCKECLKIDRHRWQKNNANPNMAGIKVCHRCKAGLTKNSFVKNKSCKDGLNGWCKECSKDSTLMSKYDISLKEFNALLLEQNSKCAICGTSEPAGRQNVFVVDHCHDSNKIRGLLCNHCNTGIGKLRDDPKILQKAIDYLLK